MIVSKKLKLTTDNLLALIANENNMSIQQLTQAMSARYQFAAAKQNGVIRRDHKKINPETGERYFTEYTVWETPGYTIESTKYGNIKSIRVRAGDNLAQTPLARVPRHRRAPGQQQQQTSAVPVSYRRSRVAKMPTSWSTLPPESAFKQGQK
jgi:hypothetical protein